MERIAMTRRAVLGTGAAAGSLAAVGLPPLGGARAMPAADAAPAYAAWVRMAAGGGARIALARAAAGGGWRPLEPDLSLDSPVAAAKVPTWQLAAAAARRMLVATAAADWRVPPESCTTEDGAIRHAGTGRRAGYAIWIEPA
jgi:CO/xanthine dehydrogenase Mo-binding subunit